MRILVIEDDEGIASVLHDGLTERGYEVEVAADGAAGAERALQNAYHVILLDLMLPGCSGYEVCRRLRQAGDRTPVLMITARDAVEDRLQGLGTGADDYLSKPFDFRELLARVEALLRRDGALDARTLTVADLEVNTSRRIASRAGVNLGLSEREYLLLETLAKHAGQVVPWSSLQARIEAEESVAAGEGSILTLREKVDFNGVPPLIRPVGTVGFQLRTVSP